MKTFVNQVTGSYDKNGEKVTIVSNKVIASLAKNCYTISIYCYKVCNRKNITINKK